MVGLVVGISVGLSVGVFEGLILDVIVDFNEGDIVGVNDGCRLISWWVMMLTSD